jgi:gluconate 2-dehydrogenase gamma chain
MTAAPEHGKSRGKPDSQPRLGLRNETWLEPLSRRTFVQRAAAVSAGALVLGARLGWPGEEAAADANASGAVGLSAAEMGTLKSLLAQLLPSDELGPGAVEAGVPAYIGGALAGPYKALLPAYQGFLATLDQAARAESADSFESLSPDRQVALLEQLESGKAPGLPPAQQDAAATGFQLVLAHMREGMFGDPMYGGNQNLAGWKLIGYPGIQLVVTERLQEVNAVVPSTSTTATHYGGTPFNGPDVN